MGLGINVLGGHLVYDRVRFHEILEGGEFPAGWPLPKRVVTHFAQGELLYNVHAQFRLLRESPLWKWPKSVRFMIGEFRFARSVSQRGWWGGHCFNAAGELTDEGGLTEVPLRSRAQAEAWLKEDWP
jgi:hypothetical protein